MQISYTELHIVNQKRDQRLRCKLESHHTSVVLCAVAVGENSKDAG